MVWVLDIVAGLILGLAFFLLVRLRMVVAPWLGQKLGQWARWVMWVFVSVAMIAVANVELFALRRILNQEFGLTSALFHELLFALIGFGSGFWLISRYITRRREKCATEQVGTGAPLGSEP